MLILPLQKSTIMKKILKLSALAILFAFAMAGCKKSESAEIPSPTKVEMPDDLSQLFETLGFEYATIEEAEQKLVEQMDECDYFDTSNFIELIHNDPRAFTYDFPLMKRLYHINCVMSDDKKLKLYSWDTNLGGTMTDWGNICQYESDGNLYVYDVSPLDLDISDDERGILTGCSVDELHSVVADNGETYYLPIIYIRECSSIGFEMPYPLVISDGKLKPVELFDDEIGCEYDIFNWFYRANAGEGWDWLYNFDNKTRTLYEPETSSIDLTDRYRLYRFDGKKFEYVGTDGGYWLHPSLRKFKQLEWLFCTDRHRIRIDMMDDGTYRYVSWPVEATMADEPALVINGGTFSDEGEYIFSNNGYTYRINPDFGDTELTILHSGKVISRQFQAVNYDD